MRGTNISNGNYNIILTNYFVVESSNYSYLILMFVFVVVNNNSNHHNKINRPNRTNELSYIVQLGLSEKATHSYMLHLFNLRSIHDHSVF